MAQSNHANAHARAPPQALTLTLALAIAIVTFASPTASAAANVRIAIKRELVRPAAALTRSTLAAAAALNWPLPPATGIDEQTAVAISSSAVPNRDQPLDGATDSNLNSTSQSLAAPARGGTVSLSNYYTLIYTGTISVGTPGKNFRAVFDTGSADLWVLSSTTTRKRLDYLNYYSHSNSATYSPNGKPWNIKYGKGWANGVLSQDTVSMNGLTAENVSFAEVTDYSSNFENKEPAIDGIVGLAFREASRSGAPTLMDALFSQHQISKKVVSFHLSNEFNAPGSVAIFGAPDMSYAPKGITYSPIVGTSGMWVLHLQELSFSGDIPSLCSGVTSRPCAALIDTGTSLIGVPNRIFLTFLAAINSHRPDCKHNIESNQIVCGSESHSGLPTLKFRFSGVEFPLYPSDYMLGNVAGMMPLGATAKSNLDLFILGDTFLKSYYSVYDFERKAIGLANRVDVPPSTPRIDWPTILMIAAAVLGVILLCLVIARVSAPTPQLAHPPIAGQHFVVPIGSGGGGGSQLAIVPSAPPPPPAASAGWTLAAPPTNANVRV